MIQLQNEKEKIRERRKRMLLKFTNNFRSRTVYLF